MVFYTFSLKKWEKEKKKVILSEEKKQKKNKIVLPWYDICRSIFPVKFYLNKYIKKEIFKKELTNSIQTNHQTFDHVSANNSFKSHLNSKSFNMLLKL